MLLMRLWSTATAASLPSDSAAFRLLEQLLCVWLLPADSCCCCNLAAASTVCLRSLLVILLLTGQPQASSRLLWDVHHHDRTSTHPCKV
jgi:hypothetical protein